jgi:hypothetical protein
VIRADHLGQTMLGTRQATRGAAFTLTFALATEALTRGIPVLGVYTGHDSRSFHARIGRRLDVRHRGSSEWLVEDCRYIVRGVSARL